MFPQLIRSWGKPRSGLPSQVADLILGRMTAAQTEGEEERTGEILLLLDK